MQSCLNLHPPASDAKECNGRNEIKIKIMSIKISTDIWKKIDLLKKNNLDEKHNQPTDKYWEILA